MRVIFLVFLCFAILGKCYGQNDTIFNGESVPKDRVPGSRFAERRMWDSMSIARRELIILRDTLGYVFVTSKSVFSEKVIDKKIRYEATGSDELLSALAESNTRLVTARSLIIGTHTRYGYLDEITCELLKEGKCLVYHKASKRLIAAITVESFVKWYGDKYYQGGYIGSRFYSGKTVLFYFHGLTWN